MIPALDFTHCEKSIVEFISIWFALALARRQNENWYRSYDGFSMCMARWMIMEFYGAWINSINFLRTLRDKGPGEFVRISNKYEIRRHGIVTRT